MLIKVEVRYVCVCVVFLSLVVNLYLKYRHNIIEVDMYGIQIRIFLICISLPISMCYITCCCFSVFFCYFIFGFSILFASFINKIEYAKPLYNMFYLYIYICIIHTCCFQLYFIYTFLFCIEKWNRINLQVRNHTQY